MKKDKTIKFLGIPFYKRKTKGNKTKYKFLGITFAKKIKKGDKKKYYLLGIKLFNKKSKEKVVIEKFLEKKVVEYRKEYVIIKENQVKELLIVNTDSIGDYILWRNFLREIKISEKYKNYKINLLGSEKYKAFAEYLDSDIVDNFYWVPSRPEKLSPKELEEVRVKLHEEQKLKRYYDTIVFSSYNSMPKKDMHNALVSVIKCEEKIIHMDRNIASRNCMDLLNFSYVYLNHNSREMFEFDINKAFFEDLLDKKIDLKYPCIESAKVNFSADFLKCRQREYIVINPCAYDKYRMWHMNNWINVIKYIQNKYHYDVVLVCGDGEKNYCQQIADDINQIYIKKNETKVFVMANLPVSQLLGILKLAKMYMGQDSGIFHVASALNIRSLCLSAGNAFFRFMNYPKNRVNIKVLFPRGVEAWRKANKDTHPDLVENINCYYINSIKMKDVYFEIDALLNKKDIIFVHRFKVTNTGDLEICPYDYFKEYFDQYIVQKFDLDDLNFLLFKKAIFIFGGGGLLDQNNDWNKWISQITSINHSIVWGVGFNKHDDVNISIPIALNNVSLLGIRDYGLEYRWLPCVSCLKTELETKQKSIRRIGCIMHYENNDKVCYDYPTIYNNAPLSDIIKFISETDVIVTNTYHAIYWSTLMGKKVILVNPFSNRFKRIKYAPQLYSGDIESDIEKAKSYPNALQECRKLNLEFFEKVKKIIER